MGRNVAIVHMFCGYQFRLRVRTLKKQRRVDGKARGFYKGEYVYCEIKSREGHQVKTRDIYVGKILDHDTSFQVEMPAEPARVFPAAPRVEQAGREPRFTSVSDFSDGSARLTAPYNGRSS